MTSGAFVLSFHADYRCRSSGACCTSGWDIPVEPDVEAGLRTALGTRSLPMAGAPLHVAHGRTLLAYDATGRCAFHEPASRTCAIHRRVGHDALPVSCRQFPRVCLLTPRGIEITLSHYCPTAADLLFAEEGPARVVRNPAGFPGSAHYEGLDARHAPPPLLRPGIWLGWDGYERWQRHVLEVLGASGPPEEALGLLSAQAEHARSWTVDRGPFPDFLEAVLAAPARVDVHQATADELYAEVMSAIPADLRPSWTPGDRAASWDGFDAPIRRYLAARAFASWVAIQGSGLRTMVRALWAALAVVRREAGGLSADAGRAVDAVLLKEAFRRADLRLVHLAAPEVLAAVHARCESA